MRADADPSPQIKQVTITGYTDRIGSDAYNLRLSQRRADGVKAYLEAEIERGDWTPAPSDAGAIFDRKSEHHGRSGRRPTQVPAFN